MNAFCPVANAFTGMIGYRLAMNGKSAAWGWKREGFLCGIRYFDSCYRRNVCQIDERKKS